LYHHQESLKSKVNKLTSLDLVHL